MEITRQRIEAWLRQAECTDWGADMSTDDQVDVLRVAIRAFDAEEEIARVTAERDDSRADIAQLRADLAAARAKVPSASVIATIRRVFETDEHPAIFEIDEYQAWLVCVDLSINEEDSHG